MKFKEIVEIINNLEDETIEVIDRKKENISREKVKELIEIYNSELLRRIAIEKIINKK